MNLDHIISETEARKDPEFVEDIIRWVDASMAMEGMKLTDEDKKRIRDCAFNPEKVELEISALIRKYRVGD